MTDLFSKFDPLIETREQLLSTGVTDPFGLVMEKVVSPTVAICSGRESWWPMLCATPPGATARKGR